VLILAPKVRFDLVKLSQLGLRQRSKPVLRHQDSQFIQTRTLRIIEGDQVSRIVPEADGQPASVVLRGILRRKRESGVK